MDLYTLDANFAKKDPVDGWKALVWTERYNQYGDVTLVWQSPSPLDAVVIEGAFLHIPESREVMLVDTVSYDKGEVTATGQSLSGFLANRMFRNTWATTSSSWNLAGVSGTLANYIIQQMCMAGGIMAGTAVLASGGSLEVIPKLSVASAPAGATLNIAVEYGDVYTAVKAVCDADNLGFTVYPPSVMDASGNLVFLAYRGSDRTSTQTAFEPVIFESAMNTLSDMQQVRSIAGYKTAAYAWAQGMNSQAAIGAAYAPGTSALTGFDRRTLMVDASDVNTADYSTAAALQAVLNRKAADALANNNYVRLTDGTLVPQSDQVYGEDYYLGDVIELRGTNNVAQQARISEYIRSQSETGYQEYPTLSVLT